MDTSFSHLFTFALGTTLPIFIVLFIGMALSARGKLSDAFIRDANQLIYKIGLPMMLFLSCASAKVNFHASGNLIIAFALMTGIVFVGVSLTARALKLQDAGVVIQGGFRGNLVILGLALAANTFGQAGVALATLPVAFTVVIYNILSIYVLDESPSLNGTFKAIIHNPLILAIAAGWLFNASGLPIPELVNTTGHYITQMVLPLALICIGASLSCSKLTQLDLGSGCANLWKLVLSPIIACAIGWALGVRGDAMIILFLLASAPTATVSFVMAQAQGANAKLAAAIVAQTTFFSLFTVTAGMMALSKLAY